MYIYVGAGWQSIIFTIRKQSVVCKKARALTHAHTVREESWISERGEDKKVKSITVD